MKKIIVLLALVLSLHASAGYEITWSSIDGGGGISTGGDDSLVGTIAQPDAGQMDGDVYELSSGYWVGGVYCFVDFAQFAQFANYWLNAPCDAGNNFCNGSDLDYSSAVEINDIGEMAYYWLDYCPTDWPWK